MTLDTDVLSAIDGFVRGGFHDKAEIMEIVCEEMFELGQLDTELVEAAVNAAMAAHEADKAAWPSVTDCDRLDDVFAALPKYGIIALHNAGYTQSDGYEDIMELHHNHPNKANIRGYCYYHGQDLERAVCGDGLMLSFGPIDASDETTEGSRTGALIVQELHRAGFATEWDGTFNTRISIPKIDWKRR